MMLKNTCLLVLMILLGASLAQAQTKAKPAAKQTSNTTQSKWVLQSSQSGKVYPVNKPVPFSESPYLIINQNNPNEQVARTEQLIFLNGQAGNRTIRRDNRVARFYFMNAGDGYNVKILAIRNTQTSQVSLPKKDCVFNVMFK